MSEQKNKVDRTPTIDKHGINVPAYRMDAYYYGFNCTGINAIDLILSSVSCAGKSFHNTEQWNETAYKYHDNQNGESPVDWIQNSAHDAADLIVNLEQQRDELLAALRGLMAIANDSNGVSGYHLNGAIAEWEDFEEIEIAERAIEKAEQ